MYIPPFFVQPSLSKMHDLMRTYPFAVLISADPTGSVDAQHLPVILNTGENAYGTMFLHVAAANPVAQRLCSDRPVTVVFTGAHAYISPRLVRKRRQSTHVEFHGSSRSGSSAPIG